MDSLADHTRRRSEPESVGTVRLANRLLLLLGALLFVNGITITLISALIPIAIGSPVIVTLVTGSIAAAYTAKRYPSRIETLRDAIRPALSRLLARDRSPRQQGGL